MSKDRTYRAGVIGIGKTRASTFPHMLATA